MDSKAKELLSYSTNPTIPVLHHSLAQTPGPDLACQDMVMESEAFISSENSCIFTSRRTRAGWLAGLEFSGRHFQNITTIAAYSRQVAPGQASTPIRRGIR